MKTYETVTEALAALYKEGYTVNFVIHPNGDFLESKETELQLHPENFSIDRFYRFEGETDPDDEMIVYAISSDDGSIKGILLNAYGVDADPNISKVVKKLQEKF